MGLIVRDVLVGVGVICLVIVGVFVLTRHDRWIGFYYPDSSDLSVSRHSPELESLEECRSWVENQRSYLSNQDPQDDYECGRKCRFNKDWGMYSCKETIR